MKAPRESRPAKIGLPALDATPVPLALVVLASGLVRFVGLGKESIWLDEATSILIARLKLSSVVAWAAGDIHPPLYYLALHFWLRFGETEFAVRARIDGPTEIEYYRHGGILLYVLRSLLG